MSDQSQGPGWWLASDGKWYPPDQAPAVPPPQTWMPPPPGPPSSTGMSTTAIVLLALGGVFALLLLSIVALQFLGDEAEQSFSSTGSAIGGGDAGGDDDGDDDGGGDGSVEPAVVPDGWALLEGDGVSIAAPDTWEEVAADAMGMSDEELSEAFPDVPEGLVDQAMSAFEQGAVLLAFDFHNEFAANVNIVRFPGETPVGVLEDQAQVELESVGADLLNAGEVELPVGEAARLGYTLDIAGPGGDAIVAHGVQYYIPVDGSTYIVTITAGSDDVGALARTMIETFRVS